MWYITNLKYRLEDGIVIKVEATYILENGIKVSSSIWVNTPEPTGDITPFNDLTEDQIIVWVKSLYDTEEVEQKVLNDFNTLQNGIGENLPWS
jgi:hypothetical protein